MVLGVPSDISSSVSPFRVRENDEHEMETIWHRFHRLLCLQRSERTQMLMQSMPRVQPSIINGLCGTKEDRMTNLHDTFDDLGHVSHVEQVVRLHGCRQEGLGGSLVHLTQNKPRRSFAKW